MVMEYDLPEDWELMTHIERLQWHVSRVEREEPVFEMLEETGVMTCFEPNEIRLRLAVVQSKRRRVSAALMVAEDEEFQGLWQSLRLALAEVRETVAERAKILNLQFRRKGLRTTDDETRTLAALRTEVDERLNTAENLEGGIIRLCDLHGVDPSPYLLADNVRENK